MSEQTMLSGGGAVTPDHREINPTTGQQKGYVVLTKEERAKGFVRPVRRSYRHVGAAPKYPLRELTGEERKHDGKYGYVMFEEYPASELPKTGKYWTQAELDRQNGCGTTTKMSQDIAETYARDPKFYGATFCCYCGKHLPVYEFAWLDAPDQRVGS